MTLKERLYQDNPVLLGNEEDIEKARLLLLDTVKNDGTIFTCGNGGSASDSEHIVGELMKSFKIKRPLSDDEIKAFENIDGGKELALRLQKTIKAISLVSQTSLGSAISNDNGYDMVYAQQLYGYGKKKDSLIALSTSGNSLNVVNSVKVAKVKGIYTISITGEKESILSKLSTITIKLPFNETYRIQEYTIPIYHYLCASLEEDLFKI